MKDNVIYRLGKAFVRLPRDKVEMLAEATVSQLYDEGYKGVGYDSLCKVLETIHTHPNSKRMQIRIRKTPNPEFSRSIWPLNWRPLQGQDVFDSSGEKVFIVPERVITTYLTDYKPSNIKLAADRWQELNFSDKIQGTDTGLIARLARQDLDVRKVYDSALEKGVHYGLLVSLTKDISEIGGKPLETEDGKLLNITEVRIVVPKATPEEIRVLNDFCERYRVPSKKTEDRLSGKTD